MDTKEEMSRRRIQRERFARARRADRDYGIQLRRIANNIGTLTHVYDPNKPESAATLVNMLREYAKLIAPWARNAAIRLLGDVAQRDAEAWAEHSREMGRSLRAEIARAPTGVLLQELLVEQVGLITSLPLKSADRVQKLALRGIVEGSRGEDIVQMILNTGEVARSRATTIARTETARVASLLTQARAQYIGSEGYIWRTGQDSDVRPLHKELEGKLIKWSDPPVAGSNGERAHAGQIYECRCWAEVVLPE